MQGVTTAIVAFIFVCLVYPNLVKHRQQYYMSLVLTLVIILFDAIAQLSSSPAFGRVMYLLTALVQILAIILLVMCIGGLSVSQLAGEMANAVEVMRRGEDKPVLVPLKGEQPRVRDEDAVIPPRRPVARPPTDSSIPMD